MVQRVKGVVAVGLDSHVVVCVGSVSVWLNVKTAGAGEDSAKGRLVGRVCDTRGPIARGIHRDYERRTCHLSYSIVNSLTADDAKAQHTDTKQTTTTRMISAGWPGQESSCGAVPRFLCDS